MTPLRPALALMLAMAAALPGCGWFEDPPKTLEPKGGYRKPQEEQRVLVQQVTNVTVEQTLSGAIVRATGLPPTQGWYDAALLPANDGQAEDGVLTYRFVVNQPLELRRTSTPQSREVTAAVYLSDIRLQDVRKIVVQGAANSRATSR